MLPAEVVARLFKEGDVVGLKFKVNNSDDKIFHFFVKTVEEPNDLEDYSLGAAAAQAAAGTNWQDITDANGRYLLEPEFERILYQAFFGVHPSYAWIYRRYPGNVDRGSLLGTRPVGDRTYRVGKTDGVKSPYRTPSSQSEFFTIKGLHPSFLGFHPYLEPASVTIRMNFFVVRFAVDYLASPTQEQAAGAKVRTVGGEALIDVPQWLR